MEGDYELFERRADGVLSWRGSVRAISAARLQVQLLALETNNECFALQATDRLVVAHVAAAREVPATAQEVSVAA